MYALNSVRLSLKPRSRRSLAKLSKPSSSHTALPPPSEKHPFLTVGGGVFWGGLGGVVSPLNNVFFGGYSQ